MTIRHALKQVARGLVYRLLSRFQGEPDYHDRELICRACGQRFIFRAAEQRRFARNGFTPPKRCGLCRSGAWRRTRGAA